MERLSATVERSAGAWGGFGMSMPADAVAANGWNQFDGLKERIGAYLKSSEAEFGRLIEALDGYGEMERNVQRAKNRLEQVTGTASFDQIESIRNFMLEGCTTSRQFLEQIEQASLRLTTASKEAQMLLSNASSLERALAPAGFVAL